MAYAIHWKIKFRVLHSNQLLTVNIWKDGTLPSGYPLTLTGAQAPFSTQEDDNEDLFQPIRTQSGYLRIVDDGTALNSSNASVSFNWKDLLPSTDTDRPVTLTDSSNNILWQGFMQAQNFSGSLYGGTQVREFPVQCCLTVTQGKDINYSQTQIQNFAYLLKQIVDSIPSGFRPQNFIIQGGTDARMWLMKKIDWQNFAALDSDGTLAARFTMYQCLEDMCRFWGWTARTHGDTMYLMCIDDQAEQSLLTITYAQLGTLAGGTSAGSTDTISSVNPSGDIYASTEIDDFRNRGANKAVVTVDGNEAADEVIDYAPESVIKYMQAQQPTIEMIDGQGIAYYGDMTQFPISGAPSPLLSGTALSGSGSFSYILCSASSISDSAIRIKKSYNGNVFASLQTVYHHSFHYNDPYNYFSLGGIQLHGTIYQQRYKVEDYSSSSKVGQKSMYVRLGIGLSKSNAKWWNGVSWQDSITAFKVSVGNADDLLRSKYNAGGMTVYSEYIATNGIDLKGLIFIDFLGSDDLDEINGERSFFITDFYVEYSRAKNLEVAGWTERKTSCIYTASNQNDVREEWNADCIYASDDQMEFCYGVILNPDGTPVETLTYGNQSQHPEQHLANRVVNFWATAKRMIRADMWNSDSVVGAITPRHYVTLDGTRLHPFAIGHEWRDDVVTMSLLEIPT